jgi:kinesin family protein C2/C3
MEEIFRVVKQGEDRYHYTISCTLLELYKTDLKDLLHAGKSKNPEAKMINVRIDKGGNVMLEGLVEKECETAEDLINYLDRGMAARKVLATNMNTQSSRSHLIFTIKVLSINKETGDKRIGKIAIVDLAGSERLSKSQVVGEGAKEAIEINKSLTALGDVIESLNKNSKSVPYRNHMLTTLLKDALGGTSKTLMFVNCSPATSNLEETINALKWAARAKKIVRKGAAALARSASTAEVGRAAAASEEM